MCDRMVACDDATMPMFVDWRGAGSIAQSTLRNPHCGSVELPCQPDSPLSAREGASMVAYNTKRRLNDGVGG